jgi:uncharacterized Fe-S cluster-containing radical SAM superfamily protein
VLVVDSGEAMRAMAIDTDQYSVRLRRRAIDTVGKRLLISRLRGSEQEADLSEPVNCGGLGRIRHFRRETADGWPDNPLPIDPACAALGIEPVDVLRVQVFQSAACNWRCWYCYVPFPLLTASEKRASWVEPSNLVECYLNQPDRPPVLDLSGGQPDLVPEWTLWMMRALEERGAADRTYLWTDDNLSNDYFWQYLSDDDIVVVANWPMFGRVGCFKGFDAESFAFNTAADPELFARQFELFARHLALGVDCYAYVTLTGPNVATVSNAIPRFVDRLQGIDELLPLRTIPLEIALWGPVHNRMNALRVQAMEVQNRAVGAWNTEIERRYSSELRDTPIHLIRLRGSRGQ